MLSEFHVHVAGKVSALALLVRDLLSDMVSGDTVKDFLTLVPRAQTVDVSSAGRIVAGHNNDAFSAAVVHFVDRTVCVSRRAA